MLLVSLSYRIQFLRHKDMIFSPSSAAINFINNVMGMPENGMSVMHTMISFSSSDNFSNLKRLLMMLETRWGGAYPKRTVPFTLWDISSFLSKWIRAESEYCFWKRKFAISNRVSVCPSKSDNSFSISSLYFSSSKRLNLQNSWTCSWVDSSFIGMTGNPRCSKLCLVVIMTEYVPFRNSSRSAS